MDLTSLTFSQMEKYPRLRDETERILTTFLREQEQLCKEHVSPHYLCTTNLHFPSPS